MYIRHLAALLALVFAVLFSSRADAFFAPPWISPENSVPGEMISLHIHGGVCDGIFEESGYPQFTQEGNAIRIRFYGQHWPDGSGDLLCAFPVGTLVYPLGVFPDGDYTVIAELAYRDFFGIPSVLTIGVASFTIAGTPSADPAPVPALGVVGIVALLAFVLGASLLKLQVRKAGVLLLALACLPLGVHAQDQTIRVLVSDAPGAPTPAAVLAWVNSSPRSPTPPLEAFKAASPLGGDYLIPDRATGDFLAWLNANPHSTRKKLEDYVLLSFAVADVPAALTALQADPYIAEASEGPSYTFSAVALLDFGIGPDPEPLGGNDQYGYFAMNIDRAWQLASGYALVGQIDMGLHEDHPALRQWTGSTYAGGNFIKVASRDVGLTGRPAQASFDPVNVDEKKPMWIDPGACTSVGALLPPAVLGHGTHVAGLLGANGSSGLNVQGTCKHCGIQMYKTAYVTCYSQSSPAQLRPLFNSDGADRGQAQAIDTGTQVLSMSYGTSLDGMNRCQAYRRFPECLVLAYGQSRDLAMVAASGNQKKDLNFPASDKRVISAGGFEENLTLWDEAPTCPPSAPSECGSNWSKLHGSYFFRLSRVSCGKSLIMLPQVSAMDCAAGV